MAASFTALPLADTHLSTLSNDPVRLIIPHEKSLLNSISQNYGVSDLEFKDDRYPLFTRTLGHQRSASSMDRGWALDQRNATHFQTADADDWSRDAANYDSYNSIQATGNMNLQTHEKHVLSADSLVQPSSSSRGPTPDGRNLTTTITEQRGMNAAINRGSKAGYNEHEALNSHPEGLSTYDATDGYISKLNPNNVSPSSRDRRSPALLGNRREAEEDAKNVNVDQEMSQDTLLPLHPSTPRHPSVGTPVKENMNRSSSAQFMTSADSPAPIPTYKASPVPVQMSSVQRVSVQQSTFITPSAASPINPLYSPGPQGPPRVQEEVCIECAMRDQDMADVDVTGPGVWDRESDIHYRELVQKEAEEEVKKAANPDYLPAIDPNRPSTKGGRLTEQNLKLWLSLVSLIYLFFSSAIAHLNHICIESPRTSVSASRDRRLCTHSNCIFGS